MPRMPQVTARELIQFLKARAFIEDRQSGSHRHAGRGISLTIRSTAGPMVGAASPRAS